MTSSNTDRTPDGLIQDFDPIPFPAFPPTEQEDARAILYAKAKAAGRLAELPASWNPDGTLKAPGETA
jgi:hypothetical protein